MSDELVGPMNGRRLRKGHPEYDAKKQAQLDDRVKIARAAAKEGDEARFKEAWALRFIKDLKLHRQDGYDAFEEWVRKKYMRSLSTVRRRLALTGALSEPLVRKFGVSKLLLAREYANRTVDDADENFDVTTLVFKVPRDDGRIADVPFKEATEPEIEDALTHQRSLAQRRAKAALPRAQQQALEQLQTALTPPGREEALVEISGRASRSGLEEDNVIRLDVRYGDLEAVLERLAHLHAARRRGQGGRPT